MRRRKNLDTNLRGALKNCEPADVLDALGGEPSNINSFNAVRAGKGAFGQGLTVGKEVVQ